ncbi:MAG: glycoside hydrolase family 43 protein [Verrucomicrobiota bacterium]
MKIYRTPRLAIVPCIALLLAALTGLRAAELDRSSTKQSAFQPGEVWLDTAGKPINAHGGGMLFHDGTYYWYGENKDGRTWLPESTKAWDGYRVDVTGVRCYSSRDLFNWQDEGLVLKAVPGDPSLDLHPSKVCERPKVVFNARTRKFVMWMHIDSEDYQAARAGVAVADQPTGPFTYLESVRPEGQDSRDQTLFLDEDGKAYRVYSSENNDTTYISLLTDDYLKHSGKFARVFEKRRMEAQVLFKHAGKYWFMASGCTGWDPNPARSAVANSIWGPWTELGNPCRGQNADQTFGGQSTFVFPVAGKENAFIFMADRWNKTNLVDSRYLWLPLQCQASKPVVPWVQRWDLSIFARGTVPPEPARPTLHSRQE